MTTWTNWAGDQTCSPRAIERPGSVDDLAGIVRSGDGPIRVAGAGHSFGDLVATEGTVVSLDRLSGLIDYDQATGLAKVFAGTRLNELNTLLDEQGRALPNLGDINVQSVAGAISTATHGTGAKLGNLATQVEALELVLADGSVRTIGSADEGGELQAARVSLGALGVISTVTLRTVPSFRLRKIDERRPLDETFRRLDEYVDGNEHFEIFVFPHADDALTRATNSTDEPPRPRGKVSAYVNEALIENRLLDVVCRLGRRHPRQIPRLNRLVTRALSPSDRVDVSHRQFSSVRNVRFTESEWAVPRAAAESMVREVLAVVKTRGFDVNFPLEVRFVAADEESFLSPSWARETCYVAAHTYQGMDWEPFLRAVQDIALAHDGRPHWGKRHFLSADQLAPRYPMWDRFQAVRGALDPTGRFANEHVRRVFG